MPGLNPFRRHTPKPKLYDFERDQVVTGYDPLSDGFAYPVAEVPERIIHPSCSCTVKPASRLLVETDPDRAYRACEVSLCDFCLGRLLEV